MGLGLMPLFDPDLPEAAFDGDGKGLARSIEVLDRIADDLGLAPLGAFLGHFEDLPDDADEPATDEEGSPDFGPEAWYDPADGLRSVAGLVRAIESDPGIAAGLERGPFTAADIIGELKELERGLRLAAEHGSRLRLEAW